MKSLKGIILILALHGMAVDEVFTWPTRSFYTNKGSDALMPMMQPYCLLVTRDHPYGWRWPLTTVTRDGRGNEKQLEESGSLGNSVKQRRQTRQQHLRSIAASGLHQDLAANRAGLAKSFRPSQPEIRNPHLGWVPLAFGVPFNKGLSKQSSATVSIQQTEISAAETASASNKPQKNAILFYEDIAHLSKSRKPSADKTPLEQEQR